MTFADEVKPAAALRHVAFAALIYLWLAIMWVGSLGSIATVIGRRALGEDPPVPLAAAMVSVYAGHFVSFLGPFCVVIIFVILRGSKSNNADDKEDNMVPLHIFGVITRLILQGSVFTGLLICGPSIFLMPIGRQVMGWEPVKGSHREIIGSMLMDLGILGSSAINCFVLVPAMFQCLRYMLQTRATED